jgi:hypothetical protein
MAAEPVQYASYSNSEPTGDGNLRGRSAVRPKGKQFAGIQFRVVHFFRVAAFRGRRSGQLRIEGYDCCVTMSASHADMDQNPDYMYDRSLESEVRKTNWLPGPLSNIQPTS